jgi:hypothetical protein
MGNVQPIPYEDVFSLKQLLQNVQDAITTLKQASYKEADKGYSAVIHLMPLDAMHPDERYCHPWYNTALKLFTSYEDLERALIGISDIWFDDAANPRRTFDFPGIILCSHETLSLVDAVNDAKSSFKQRVLELKAKYKDLTDSDIESELLMREGEWTSLETVKQAFNQAGLARICTKQVYRKIPSIKEPGLLRAKYYHNPKRPSRPRTVAQQLEKFHAKVKKGETTQDLIEAIEVLKNMDPTIVISERQNSNEIITVNIKLADTSSNKGSTKWTQVTGVLPVFCLGEPSFDVKQIVDFTSLDIPFDIRNSDKKRPSRKGQISWSATPFLPAFRLYLSSKDD